MHTYTQMKGEPSNRLQKFVDILHTTDRVHNYYTIIISLRVDILDYLQQDGINQTYVAQLLKTSNPKFSTMVNMLKVWPILDGVNTQVIVQIKDKTIQYEL